MSNYRAIIIGASTTGKTTIANYLKEHTDLEVMEADEVLIEMNNGTYPMDDHLKLAVLAPKMVENVLNLSNIIFLSNTHYFTASDLEKARNKGFLVMQLALTRNIMNERSKYRQEHHGYEDHTKYFNEMQDYQDKIFKAGLVDKVINTEEPIENIIEKIQLYLDIHNH